MLQILENKEEVIRFTASNELEFEAMYELFDYLFPTMSYDIDVVGDEIIVIIKADTTIN